MESGPITLKKDELAAILESAWSTGFWHRSGVAPALQSAPEGFGRGTATLHTSDGRITEMDSQATNEFIHGCVGGEPQSGTMKVAATETQSEILRPWSIQFPACRLALNFYFSTGPAKGIKPHFDNHHVFAYQLVGEKRWHVGKKISVASPERVSHYPVVSPPIISIEETVEGDMLYLAPGVWHGAETDRLSIHATVGVYPPTYAEYLRQLVTQRAQEDLILRSEISPRVEVDSGLIFFEQPSEADLRNLVWRLSRAGRFEQRTAATQMSLSIPTDPSPALAAVDKIWDSTAPKERMAIYLRGSAARPPEVRTHEPWDIDLVLVTETECISPLQRQTVEGIDVDLKVIDVKSFVSSPWYLPTRYLLAEEGILLRGRDIVSELPRVPLSDALAMATAQRQRRAVRLNLEQLRNADSSIMDLRRAAKSVLRLATAPIMDKTPRYERDPAVCAWFLAAALPECSDVWAGLLTAMDGLSMPTASRVADMVDTAATAFIERFPKYWPPQS